MCTLEQDIKTYPGLIVYEISSLRFCSNIASINNLVKLNQVNILADYYERVFTEIVVNEKTYPLVNMQLLLKLRRQDLTDSSRLLLYDSETTKYFFIANRIFHIVTCESKFREAPLISKPTIRSEYIAGAIMFEDTEQHIIDMEKVGKTLNKKKILND